MNDHWTNDAELVEQYVRGTMGEDERTALKAHLGVCPPCRETVERERLVTQGIRLYGRSLLKERLKTMVGQRERKLVPWPHVVSIAAALLIVVGLGITHRWWGGEELVVHEEDIAAGISLPAEEGAIARPDEPVPEGMAEESAGLPATRSAGRRRGSDRAIVPPMPRAGDQSAELDSRWIAGVIVDVPVRRREDADAALMMRGGEAKAAEQDLRQVETDGVMDGQGVRILQRSEHELPHDQQSQLKRAMIPTMFRQAGDRVELTLFSDTLDLERQAVQIRWISPDSLLVLIDGSAVAYKIPVKQASPR